MSCTCIDFTWIKTRFKFRSLWTAWLFLFYSRMFGHMFYCVVKNIDRHLINKCYIFEDNTMTNCFDNTHIKKHLKFQYYRNVASRIYIILHKLRSAMSILWGTIYIIFVKPKTIFLFAKHISLSSWNQVWLALSWDR